MSNDFLPEKDKDVVAWAAKFVMIAAANITATQLTTVQITALSTKSTDAQTAINDSETKHKAAEAATLVKNDKLTLLKTDARELNRLLQGNLNVTAETKVKLGLKVRPAKPKPVDPVAPSRLQVIGNSGNQNVLAWDANGNHANILYELQASYGEGEPFFIVTSLTGTRYVHQGVKPGQEMIYRVRANRRKVYSGYSNLATIYPVAASEVKLPMVNTLKLKKAA